MTIMIMSKLEIEQDKIDADLEDLKNMMEDILNQIVVVDMDYLYELQEHVANLINNFEDIQLELEDDD